MCMYVTYIQTYNHSKYRHKCETYYRLQITRQPKGKVSEELTHSASELVTYREMFRILINSAFHKVITTSNLPWKLDRARALNYA